MPRQKVRSTIVLALTYLGAATGCAGATFSVTAFKAHHPVSFSAGLPDANGNVYVLGHGLEGSGTFALQARRYSTLWSHAPRKRLDLSAEIDREVERLGGDGVVHLSITTRGCALNQLIPLTILPFWPGCQDIRVEGVVVKRKASAPPDLPADRSYPLPNVPALDSFAPAPRTEV